MKKKLLLIGIILLFVSILCAVQSYASDDIIVVLDPGHGGYDSGAVAGGIQEKDVNWKIANRVKEILDQAPGITGILTRGENECPSLEERALVAKRNHANLVVSFHINSSNSNFGVRGAETYVTGNMNSPRFYQASSKLASSVLANLRSMGIPSYSISPKIRYTEENRYYSDGALCDYYGIIRNPMYYGIPSVLIEHCFINNVADRESFLRNDAQIYQMAEQDARAIIENKDLFYINKEDNNVNAGLQQLQILTKEQYLTGNVIVVEWINGMQTVPSVLPTIKLKSTDGTVEMNCYVRQVYGNEYYFDLAIKDIDKSKKYVIMIESNDKNMIPKNHTIRLNLGNDRRFGNTINRNFEIENNQIKMIERKYEGNINTDLKDLQKGIGTNGATYLTGEIVVVEWINGVSNVPITKPKISIKSTDGQIELEAYAKATGTNTYYFDRYIEGIDASKEYELIVESVDPANISKKKQKVVDFTGNLSNKNLGRYQDRKIVLKGNKIIFESYQYEGNMNTDLKELTKGEGANGAAYLSGEIVVVEWINGVSNVPTMKPKIALRSTDGEVELEAFVKATGTNTYYFDRYIEGIDTTKEYELIAESIDPSNISKKKVKVVDYNRFSENKVIGVYHKQEITLKKNKIFFREYQYEGEMNTDLKELTKGNGANGATYLSGEIVVVEWINGISNVPTMKPRIALRSTDGKVELEAFVKETGTNTYYFDRYIEGIDTSKEYELIVESVDPANKSKKKLKIVDFTNHFSNLSLGEYHETEIILGANKILFDKKLQEETKEKSLETENLETNHLKNNLKEEDSEEVNNLK